MFKNKKLQYALYVVVCFSLKSLFTYSHAHTHTYTLFTHRTDTRATVATVTQCVCVCSFVVSNVVPYLHWWREKGLKNDECFHLDYHSAAGATTAFCCRLYTIILLFFFNWSAVRGGSAMTCFLINRSTQVARRSVNRHNRLRTHNTARLAWSPFFFLLFSCFHTPSPPRAASKFEINTRIR